MKLLFSKVLRVVMDSHTLRTFLDKLVCKKRIPYSYVAAKDQISEIDFDKSPLSVIINTSKSNIINRGHWVCLIVWNKSNCEFWDSYGKSPGYYNIEFPIFLKYKTVSKDVQGFNSRVCGLYCLEFIIMRSHGYSVEYHHKLYSTDRNRNDKLLVTNMKPVIASSKVVIGQICCSRAKNEIE